MSSFLEVLSYYRQMFGESNVFPDKEHLERSRPCIEAHHGHKEETEYTIMTRSTLMESYFKQIDHADLIVVMNEKNGEEHYGVGTTLELGYAFSKGKRIQFTRKPTNPNILSLINGQQKHTLCVVT